MSDSPSQFPNCVMLTVPDMAASIRFYSDICGFEVTESWPAGDSPMWANLVLGRQSIMLGVPMDPDDVPAMCPDEPLEQAWHEGIAREFQEHKAGVGAYFYIMVEDVDTYHAQVVDRGGKPATEPKSQFYGLRVFGIQDPSGYRLLFYSPLQMDNCQSCGMPLADAEPGVIYCQHCTDDSGKLRPYEQVLEGTIRGYFMGAQKMERERAEVAAKEYLAQMPAWNPEAIG
jgi:uncharacterized glyoxalase superfamily protein PhnB